MTLWLIRHALPLIDKGICYGQLDVPANPEATRACALELHKILPRGIAVISSPLQRCELLTKELIGLRPDLRVRSDPGLQEMHFGQWEGQPWADIYAAELAAWTADFAHYRVGGTGGSTGESTGENVSQFMARVATAFDELDPATDTLWVTHAGVIRAATLIAQGIRHISRANQWPIDAPSYGQWCKLAITMTVTVKP